MYEKRNEPISLEEDTSLPFRTGFLALWNEVREILDMAKLLIPKRNKRGVYTLTHL